LLLPFWFGRIIARFWNPIKVFFGEKKKRVILFLDLRILNYVDRGMMIVLFLETFLVDWIDMI
jgi:hypothetical protein